MFATRLKKRYIAVFLSLFVLPGLVLAAYASFRSPGDVPRFPPPIDRDLGAIAERDTLVALTAYNATSYVLYRGQPMGYEYEMLKAFAEEMDINLRMQVVPRDSLFAMLNRGDGDIGAARIVPTEEDTLNFAFSAELYRTRPMVVQREAAPSSGLTDLAEDTVADSNLADAHISTEPQILEVRARTINRPAELAGEDVYVPEDHAYVERLIELEDRVTGDIRVIEVDTTSERLIRQVADAQIPFTVAQENVAELEESFNQNLVVSPAIGDEHPVTWAVRGNAPELLNALNTWIEANRDQGPIRTLYQKYFVDRRGYRERVASRYLTGETGTLSDWDDLLRRNAAQIDWDWRLLAAQTYQESRFRPRAESWAGAMGLLQLMPGTAGDLGVSDPFDPEQNVDGAVRYLRWLEETYWNDTIADPEERLKFVLASYNAGAGHVMDAQRLAEKHGDDPKVWADVAFWLLRKSERRWYTDPVVRHGFCRGLEPVEYVARILDRFEHYRQFVAEQNGDVSA
ncbi:MAG: transporter substrate-binding domain-containing protein [Rhodothermaceae bacterium]|nr:transporter substrate-binding domain-containing protein [Rhodothermaceae bacterium]